MAKEQREHRLQGYADELAGEPEELNGLAEKLGLEPYDTNYWIVDYDDVNELAAYGGFQKRYPHWRWGMQYDRQKKQSEFMGGKILEMVINDDPAQAYLQESNSEADQKSVIAHVEGHSDFFARNQWYQLFRDDPDSVNMLGHHADRIEEYMEDPDIGRERVERFIDSILCVEDLINQHQPYREAKRLVEEEGADIEEYERVKEAVENLDLDRYMEESVFDEEFFEQFGEEDGAPGVPEEPMRDALLFFRQYGKSYDAETDRAVEFEDWQRDVLDMMRKEAYYFAPQKMTKVMNEGWASYWQTRMMMGLGYADTEDMWEEGRSAAAMLYDKGKFNPYALGLELWEYIENKANREEVVSKLLQVEGITEDNFFDAVDFDEVYEQLLPQEELRKVDFDSLDEFEDAVDDSKIDMESLDRAREVRNILQQEEVLEDVTELYVEALKEGEGGLEYLAEEVREEYGDILDEEMRKGLLQSFREFSAEVDDSAGKRAKKALAEAMTDTDHDSWEERMRRKKEIRQVMNNPSVLERITDSYMGALRDGNEFEELLEGRFEDVLDGELVERLAESYSGFIEAVEDNAYDEVKQSVKDVMDVDRHPWKVLSFEGLAEKLYSLTRNGGFVENLKHDELREIAEWKTDETMRYETVEEALQDVDRTKGWEKMFEECRISNDVTFIDQHITQEFVDENNYYVSENLPLDRFGEQALPVVTSVDVEDVKKKLVFQFTNFGKPMMKVHDANYHNNGELLLGHHYNGVDLDFEKAFETMRMIFPELWGRDVHVKTIQKQWDYEANERTARKKMLSMWMDFDMDWEDEIPEPEERGVLLSFDGDLFDLQVLPDAAVEDIRADELDYKTIPEEWLR